MSHWKSSGSEDDRRNDEVKLDLRDASATASKDAQRLWWHLLIWKGKKGKREWVDGRQIRTNYIFRESYSSIIF